MLISCGKCGRKTTDGSRRKHGRNGNVRSLPYVEVLLFRVVQDQWKFFLTYRKDEHFDGWHIPGGIWRTEWSIREACREVAKREIRSRVRFIEKVYDEKWFDHPYGYPHSFVCVCFLGYGVSYPQETETQRFFSEIPSPMVRHHVEFIGKALEYLRFFIRC